LRLSGSDWLVEPFPVDLPANVEAECKQYEVEWYAYRQALRDLPENTTDPAQVVWPKPPPAPLLPVSEQTARVANKKK
jgi:hypothetical protein